MLGNFFNKLGNTILFYSDKDGNAVFKNFCIFKNDGNLYHLNLTKQEVGKILEYRFHLNKILRGLIIATIIIAYLIFIKFNPSLTNILITEVLTIILIAGYRLAFELLYNKKLQDKYGKFKIIDFKPPITKEQSKAFVNNVIFKVLATIFCVTIFSLPAFILNFAIYEMVTMKKPHYKSAIKLSQVYSSIYPKNTGILDLTAYAKYETQDYEGAVEDYKNIFEIKGKYFTNKDIERFSNLLYLEKKINGSETAIDVFNEYATKKKLSVLDAIKMLWIKSIFKIENHRYNTVLYDYEELAQSLPENDTRNRFYINCDKTYMLYLMGEYPKAIKEYDNLIKFAKENKEEYSKDLENLYAERGFTKWKLGDIKGKDKDFLESGIDLEKINSREPSYQFLGFIGKKKRK